jgi:DeoR/GlpR family transcriptional regulator of sugar metabolism
VFFLSESTVRRLLAEMERNKLIQRFHGGASIPGVAGAAQKVESRRAQRIREKAAIGKAAAELVEDGMTLMLLGGTTVSAVCPYIRGRSVTVITTSIPVVNSLLPEKTMKLILLGGVVNPPELEVRGALTAEGLQRLRADMLFIGATFVHPTRGLMTDDPDAVAAYRACLSRSDKRILLADSSKFRTGGVTVVAALDELDAIITDEGLPGEAAAVLGGQNIPVTIAKLS